MENKLGARGFLAVTAVALTLYAGFFKGSKLVASLPVDLTVAGVVLTALALVAVSGQPSRFKPALPVFGLGLVFLLGFGDPATGDGTTKIEKLYLITLAAAVGVAVLLHIEKRQRIWVRAQIAIGALLSIGAMLAPTPTLDIGSSSLSLDGSTTISAGRAAGVAVVGCLVLALFGANHRRRYAVVGVALIYPLLASGSRGPVAAAVLAVSLVTVLAPTTKLRRLTRIGLMAAAGLAGYYMLRGDTGGGGVGRVSSSLLAGNFSDTSSAARFTLWRDAVGYIAHHPFGAGWGHIATASNSFNLLGSNGLTYPHNVLLEVTGEAGWLAGAAVIAFLWRGLRRLRRAADDPFRAALFGIAVFFVTNALVSGDVNDNRLMWASVALGWAVSAKSRQQSSVNVASPPLQQPESLGPKGQVPVV